MEIEKALIDFLGKAEYDKDGGLIWACHGEGDGATLTRILDVRAWGTISQMFKEQEEAALFQDKMGQFIADAINEKIKRIRNRPNADNQQRIITEEGLENILNDFGNHSLAKGKFMANSNSVAAYASAFIRNEHPLMGFDCVNRDRMLVVIGFAAWIYIIHGDLMTACKHYGFTKVEQLYAKYVEIRPLVKNVEF